MRTGVERTGEPEVRRTFGGGWPAALAAGTIGGVALGLVTTWAHTSLGVRGGLPFWLENVGGPWIAVAFAAGALSGRRVPGAVAGVLAMVSAVAVYDLAGGVSFVRPFWLTVGLGIGVVFGALGGWWGEVPGARWVAAGFTGGVIAGEAVALAVGGLPHPLFSRRFALAQGMLGLGGGALLGWRAGWWRAGSLGLAVAGAIGLVEVLTGLPSRVIW